MSLVTVSGNVLGFIGSQLGKLNTFKSGTVRFALVLPPRSNQLPVESGSGRAAQLHIDAPVAWDGAFRANILPNDAILPAGTVYSVALMIPNVNVVPLPYVFEGPGPFNLHTMNPIMEIEVKNRQVASLTSQLADAQARLQKFDGHKERAGELRKQITELQGVHHGYSLALDILSSERDQVHAELRALENRNGQLKELRAQHADIVSRMQVLDSLNQNLSEEDLQLRLAVLNQRIHSSQGSGDQIKALDAEARSHEALMAPAAELERQVSDLQNQLKELA
jgi:hypothetical protein